MDGGIFHDDAAIFPDIIMLIAGDPVLFDVDKGNNHIGIDAIVVRIVYDLADITEVSIYSILGQLIFDGIQSLINHAWLFVDLNKTIDYLSGKMRLAFAGLFYR